MRKSSNKYKEKQKELVKTLREIDDFIRGKINPETGEREGGKGRRPSQYKEDEKKMWWTLNSVKLKVERLKEKQLRGENLDSEEQEILEIYEEIARDFPFIKRKSMLEIAKEVDEYIRGKINPETGEREGGICRRPNQLFEQERRMWWTLNNVQQKVKKLKEKQLEGEKINPEEQEIILIYEKLNKDFPPRAIKTTKEKILEVDEYIRGKINPETGEREGGTRRRPKGKSNDKKERCVKHELDFVAQEVKKMKERKLKGEKLSEEEEKIIIICEKINEDYPSLRDKSRIKAKKQAINLQVKELYESYELLESKEEERKQ